MLYSNNDGGDVIADDVIADDVTTNEETTDPAVEGNTIIEGDAPATANLTDQSSHDLEAESHDHSRTLDVHIDNSNHKKLSVNGLSYRRLLEKEELEDSEDNTIVMEDLAVETCVATIKHKNGISSSFMVKLKLVKDHAVSTFLIFLSLLK